jgi:Holliday junction resolvase
VASGVSDFLNRPKNAGTTREKSTQQEKRLAREFVGRTTPGSGAGTIKGDVHTKEEMVEAKTTSKRQYTLKLNDLDKLAHEARVSGKRPVLVVQFEHDTGGFLRPDEWVLIPKDDYLALKEPTT